MPIRTITPAEVQALISAGGPVDLIDVRTPGEYAAVHAVGARLVPLSGLDPAAVMAGRSAAAEAPVYIICKSGARSAAAATAFIDAGFTQVFSVAGGTDAWVGAGLPVERKPGGSHSGSGLLRQIMIMGGTLVAVALLMPCSPYSVWGSAYCPTTPAAASASPATAAESIDFARDVVTASATMAVLVDFNATWCGPCRKLAPELERLAGERTQTLRLVKIDVDRHAEVASAQGVESIPDIRLWKGGREVARFTGYRPHAELVTWLDQSLKGL